MAEIGSCASSAQFNVASSSYQRLASCLAFLSCGPNSREPLNAALWTCFSLTKAKTRNPTRSSNPWAATVATSPICACQVCVGSDKLALLHSTPTPQSTAIIFPYAISRSLPHLSLCASAPSATDKGNEQTNISASHASLPQKIAHGLTCHFNLQHLYYSAPKSDSNQ